MRSVVVTGGTRGLGLGIGRRLAECGFCVVAVARRAGDEFALAQQQTEAAGQGSLQFLSCDLANIEALPDLAKQVQKQCGALYGLVNNAGVSTHGLLAMTATEAMERVVRLNTLSPMVLTKHMVRSMLAAGEGRVVNISSITAQTGYSGLSVYAATKASMIGFTRSLAREVGRAGITVNAVAPGFADTEMTSEFTDEQRQRIQRRSALRRFIEVQDVANAVEFLMSERARNITGTVMTVDAGNTA